MKCAMVMGGLAHGVIERGSGQDSAIEIIFSKCVPF